MPKPIQVGRKERMTFAKINEVCEMPNLIQIQTDSYKWFIEEGIREVFRDTGAIEDHTGTLALEFVDYRIDEKTKYSVLGTIIFPITKIFFIYYYLFIFII
mgnify:CR=1 FL=1